MSTLTLLLAAASMCDWGLTCSTTLTFVSLTPSVAARVTALFGRRVVLGEAGAVYCAPKASEAVLLGFRLCGELALPGLPGMFLPIGVLFVNSTAGA